ncbi:carboxymuconolactone decarboxylase family protein [Nocardia sp. CDC160]|uniref:carboxymuconolactone decarboxylase family protein n=1 Tax=Nocardia sp. CDC160 TaxID=3112166 RepID=UPI002DBD402F|nr:carboxymuconolactone decarboxylase family protein [Nocardia sp. CDC160]MEC3919380.1 carboxymuconolactone decarboxylase family protein [Nocardia sp. CDC160]
MTEIDTPRRWRRTDWPRAELGGPGTIGPVAWTASRVGGAFTGGGRVHAIEALGLVPGLVKYYGVFFGYVNSLTGLARFDSELIILRTAWTVGSYYEWFQHVYVSRIAGLTLRDVARVAAGPDAAGWDERQRALLRAVDELVAHRRISDATWAALREFYDDRRLADLCLLTGNYAMLAMVLNSIGVPTEVGGWQSRAVRWLRRGEGIDGVLDRTSLVTGRDDGLPVPPPPVHTLDELADPGTVIDRLGAATHWSPADSERVPLGGFQDTGLLAWTLSRVGGFFTRGGSVAASDALGVDPRIMRHYLPFAAKLVLGSHLSRRDTELATLRITWNSGVKYEWYYHAHLSRLSGVTLAEVERAAAGPSAPGWSAREQVLLTAVDELYSARFLSEETWARLRGHYSERKLAALCVLVGHYDMLAMLFRTFDVQPEPGALQSGPLGWLRKRPA